MYRHIASASLLAIALCLPAAAAEQHHWGYEGAEDASHWGELSPDWKECGIGQQQSPIDIVKTSAIAADFNAAEVHWMPFVPKIVDNGHTIQVNTDGRAGYAELNGVKYNLLQFHFHHQSEHTIDGAHSPLEVHFVHQSEAGDLLVLGVLMNEGKLNQAVETIEAAWPAVGAEAGGDRYDASSMLPANHASFRYQGSLTTPPCSQIVTWNVYADPVEVSAEQVALFASHYANNARPVQPLNRRFLLTDAR